MGFKLIPIGILSMGKISMRAMEMRIKFIWKSNCLNHIGKMKEFLNKIDYIIGINTTKGTSMMDRKMKYSDFNIYNMYIIGFGNYKIKYIRRVYKFITMEAPPIS